MNDDELIERLRSTLQAEADAVTPMHGTPRVSPARRRHRSRVLGVPTRALAGLTAAAAIAAAVAVAVSLHGGSADQTTVVGPTNTVAHPGATRHDPASGTGGSDGRRSGVPSTTPTTTATTPTTATVPGTAEDPVSPGFAPRSVTFVSTTAGWALGTVPCGTTLCASVAATTDGGGTWWAVQAPTTGPGTDPEDLQIRFATAERGWAYDTAPGDEQLWTTADGGRSWTSEAVPGPSGGTIDDLEVGGGSTGTAVMAVTTPGSLNGVDVDTAPVADPTFTHVGTIPHPAGGSGESATVVVQGTDSWVIGYNDRSLIGGLRSTGGGWAPWQSSCPATSSPALLAASGPNDLVAVCEPSGFGDNTASTVTSSDSGSTFASSAVTPDDLSLIATPAPGTVVGASTTDPGTLVASLDGGPWQTVYVADGSSSVLQVGFESAHQGVAVVDGAGGTSLLMTTDGGTSWHQVSFGS